MNKKEWIETRIKHDRKSVPEGKPYDYSKVPKEFKMVDRVTVICPEHGAYDVYAFSHVNHKCKECGSNQLSLDRKGVLNPNRKILSVKQVRKRAEKLWPRYDFSKIKTWSGNKDEWKVKCPEHGWFSNTAFNFLYPASSKMCPKCRESAKKEQSKQQSKVMLDKFPFMVKFLGYKLVEYKSSHQPAKLRCKEHGIFTVPKAYYVNTGFLCPECRKGGSFPEKLLKDALNKAGLVGRVTLHNRHILDATRELDFYLPDHKVAIEVNGIYHHSFKEPDYHYNKTIEAKEHGIELLHFTDTEIVKNLNLVVSMIHAKCGIFAYRFGARQTTAYQIEYKVAAKFLRKNHLQGPISGSNYIGLYSFLDDKETLVAVAVFGKPRFSKDYDYELLRFATKASFQIVGGLSKIVSAFSTLHSGKLVSYANLNYSVGNAYEASGWTFVRRSKPSFFWAHASKPSLSRYKAQKKNLAKLLPRYDDSLSQTVNMTKHGYLKNYDCGTYVYEIML